MTNEVFFWMLGVMLILVFLTIGPAIHAHEERKISKTLMGFVAFASMFAVPTFVFWLFLPTKTEKVTQFDVSEHIVKRSVDCVSYKINTKKTKCTDEAFVYLNAEDSDSLELKREIDYNRFSQVLSDRFILSGKRSGEIYDVTFADD